jgi:polysaccharide biosynthesis transport protein
MRELSPYFINRNAPEVNTYFPASADAFRQGEPSFREYWHAIAKRWWLIVSLVVCTLAVAGLIVSFMTPSYTASSTVLIEPQAPQVLNMRDLETQETGELAAENYYGTEYKILESRSLAARVIRELNLQNEAFLHPKETKGVEAIVSVKKSFADSSKDPSALDDDSNSGTLGVDARVIDAYLKDLKIRPEPGTRLVTVAFSAPNPVLAARIVNAQVRAYITRGTALHAEASESAVKYLQTKLAELRVKVENSEASLNAYRRQRGIVADASGDSNRVVMERLIDLNKSLTEAETQLITLESQVHLINTKNYDALPAVANDALIQTLRGQQAKVQAEYASLADQYKPSYPPLAQLGATLKETQAHLNREIHRVAAGVELSYEAAADRVSSLNAKIDVEKTRALALNDASLQDAILSRAVDTNRNLYKNILERMTQMSMATGVSASNVSVLDSATPPLLPSSPKTLLTLGSSGALALLIGISLACFLERFDETFKDADEVEQYVGVPSLAMVPDFKKLKASGYGSKSLLFSRPASAQTKANGAMIVAEQNGSFSAATEAYRALRLGLLLSRADKPPKVILITSGAPREGKTVTAINTAIAFAHMGSRVLLIDADLRSPRCHKLLKLPNHQGLTEILAGQRRPDELILPTGIDGLECITAGSTPPNPGRLLGSQTMADLLLYLKATYDCILIDSAPVMPVTDTLHLMTTVDGVLLVVGPGVPRQRVKQVCARLTQIHAPLLGIVQNQIDLANHRRAGDYYYYYPQVHKSQDESAEQMSGH